MKRIAELTDTTTSSTGISNIQAKIWLKEITDAARPLFRFRQCVKEYRVPIGTKDFAVPVRSYYLRTITDNTTEAGAVTFTELTNLTAVTLTPTMHHKGIAISQHAIDTSIVNLIQAAREELTENFVDVVDIAIRTELETATAGAYATRGRSDVFGGDASSTSTVAVGDIITPDAIADAKMKLMSRYQWYWSGTSSYRADLFKNPWRPTPDEPFILFVAPEQEAALVKNSQFTNASEYGDNEVVLNGEIGRYIGVKVVVSDNVGGSLVWGSGGNVAGHTCLLVKAKKCAALAILHEPDLRIFDYPTEMETRIVMYWSHDVEILHDDAVCFVTVSDK